MVIRPQEAVVEKRQEPESVAAQYKTRCPHCQAQFRIGEQHLRQAKGQVRCGSCLKVFLATENLVQDAPPAPASDAAPTRRTIRKDKRPAPPSGSDTPAPKWDMPEDEPAQTPDTRWTLNEDDSAASAPPARATKPEKTRDDDEAPNDTRVSLGGLELSDSFLSLDGDEDDDRLRHDDFSDMAGVASGDSSSGTDDSWAEQLLEELEDEQPPRPPRADALSLSESEDEQATRTANAARHERTRQNTARAMREKDEWMQDIETADPFDAASEDLLAGLGSDHIGDIDLPEPDRPGRRSDLGETLRWSAASLALLILLGVQYLIFEFDDLARRPALRPVYAALCDRLPCDLPSLTDISALRASNLVVRPHPVAEDALMVDLLLHNRGPHAQPYPDLELGFTSLEGNAVASRRFTPEEYLQGEVAPGDLIPVDTPVHISLEILDPGEQAVNYILRPLPPTSSQG